MPLPAESNVPRTRRGDWQTIRMLGGIDVGVPQVVAKRARCLVDLDRRRLEQRHDVVQRSVVRTRLPQALHELSKPSRKRIVAFGQRTFRPGGRLDQARRVGEPALRCSKVGPFGGADRQRREIALPFGERIALGGTRRRGGRCRIAPCNGIAPRAPRIGDRRYQCGMAAELVEQQALRLGAHQRLVCVLAMQVEQCLAEFLADRRVVEIPRVAWRPILHGVILRTRPAKSAARYAAIWTKDGSP